MYASMFPGGPLKNLVLLSAPTEFAPQNPGLLGLWTHASRNGGSFFDPAIVPQVFGNLPTDLASSFINTAASLQAAGVGMAARSVAFGLYDASLREVRVWAGRDVSLRSWLAVSKWVDDAAPFPGEIFRRWVRDFYEREARQGAGGAPRAQGGPLEHPVPRAQHLGQVRLRGPAVPDEGHDRPRRQPGQGVRLAGRRARRDAGRARRRGPVAQGQGLARAALSSLGERRRPGAGAFCGRGLRLVLREIEELAGAQQLVAAHRVQAVEVTHKVARVGAVKGEEVVVGRHDQAEVQRLG